MTAYNVVSPGAMVAGQAEDISVVLANFNAIANVLNGNIDNSNISPSAAIDPSKLAPGAGGSGGPMPAGIIQQFASATPPTGWLLCDGASYDRTTYSALFTVVGVSFGAVDGAHFNVPDMRARVPAGYGGPGSAAQYASVGLNDNLALGTRSLYHRHSSTQTLPDHGHSISDPGHAHVLDQQGFNNSNPGDVGATGQHTSAMNGPVIGGGGLGIHSHGMFGAATNITVTGITSAPAINGGVGVGTPIDGPCFMTLAFIIKT